MKRKPLLACCRVSSKSAAATRYRRIQIPASEVTADAVSHGIALVAGSCMRHWNPELYNGSTDMEAVIRVLDDRYGFWNEDVEHQDPFGGQLAKR